MAVGIYFDSCGRIRAPVPGLLFSLSNQVDLVQEGFDIILVLDGHKVRLEVLSHGWLLVAISPAWKLSGYSTDLLGTVMVSVFLWSVV